MTRTETTNEQSSPLPSLSSRNKPLKQEEVVMVSSTSDTATIAVEDGSNSSQQHAEPSPHPLKKRRLDENLSTPHQSSTTKDQHQHHADSVTGMVSWDDDNNVIHLQQDPAVIFPLEYKESDVWYSRLDYQQFLLDRIDTVKRLRDEWRMSQSNAQSNDNSLEDVIGAEETTSSPTFTDTTTTTQETTGKINDINNDDHNHHHCMRGLEPFQDCITHQEMHSKRNLHKSTIIVEQARQAMLGINDPDRFRFLVAPQSNLALCRAQRLAAMDEAEVYPHKRRRRSRRSSTSAITRNVAACIDTGGRSTQESNILQDSTADGLQFKSNPCVSQIMTKPTIPTIGRSKSMDLTPTATNLLSPNNTDGSLFSEDIRKLQEKNARRLMELYRGGRKSDSTRDQLFRFSTLRRDSLLGSSMNMSHINIGPMGIVAAGRNCVTSRTGSANHCWPRTVTSLARGGMPPSTANATPSSPSQQEQQHQQDMMEMMPMATRFHLRRDSLNHLVASSSPN